MKIMQILIAGPVRSGTDDRPELIDANLKRMQQAVLEVWQKGHVPVIGEWLALPLAQAAGSTRIGDEISEAYLYPVAHRLIGRCDAILRLDGASRGADNDVRIGQSLGLTIYTSLNQLPQSGVQQ